MLGLTVLPMVLTEDIIPGRGRVGYPGCVTYTSDRFGLIITTNARSPGEIT